MAVGEGHPGLDTLTGNDAGLLKTESLPSPSGTPPTTRPYLFLVLPKRLGTYELLSLKPPQSQFSSTF